MQLTSILLEISKVSDFQGKNADVSRTQEVCRVIHVFNENC